MRTDTTARDRRPGDGFAPRWITPASFGILAWSFLLDMLGSVIHFNQWILETSLLQPPAIEPATDPSTARFARRDLRTT